MHNSHYKFGTFLALLGVIILGTSFVFFEKHTQNSIARLSHDLVVLSTTVDTLSESIKDLQSGRNEALQRLSGSLEIPTPIALFETSLASKITPTATTMTLVSATDKTGTTLASSTYAFIIDEGTASEEMVIADCTGTSCTNVTRGIHPITGTTSVTALKKEHRRSASVKITDGPLLLVLTRILNGIGTIPNVLSYTSHPTFTSGNQLVDKTYSDSLSYNGVATSTESNFGGVWLATAAQQASSTNGKPNKPYVLQSMNATDTPTYGCNTGFLSTAGSGCLVTALLDGKISPRFIATSSAYTYNFAATMNFTGPMTYSGATSTFNATTTGTGKTLNANLFMTLNASTTLTGGGTPQPVFIATSTNTLQLSDANVDSLSNFLGFAVSSVSATGASSTIVQIGGIVPGFSGLTAGAAYYVQDAVGTIGTTVGTNELYVGRAMSTTQILLDRKDDNWQYLGSQSCSPPNGTSVTCDTGSAQFARFAVVNVVSGTANTCTAGTASNASTVQLIAYKIGQTAPTTTVSPNCATTRSPSGYVSLTATFTSTSSIRVSISSSDSLINPAPSTAYFYR